MLNNREGWREGESYKGPTQNPSQVYNFYIWDEGAHTSTQVPTPLVYLVSKIVLVGTFKRESYKERSNAKSDG